MAGECQDCGRALRSATAVRCRSCNARHVMRERPSVAGESNPNWRGGSKVGPHACTRCGASISWLTARRSGLCRHCARPKQGQKACVTCGAPIGPRAVECKRCWQKRPIPAHPGRVCPTCGSEKSYYADECRACAKQRARTAAACIECGAERASRQKGQRCWPCHRARIQQRAEVKLGMYGLTRAERRTLEEAQGHACAICGRPESALHQSGSRRRLCVDHDHATGAVRGLLCSRCNLVLGRMGDDSDLLRRAADYLDRCWAVTITINN